MRTLWKGAVLLSFAALVAAFSGCSGALQSLPSSQPVPNGNAAPLSTTNAAAQGMCSIYSGFGALSLCHDTDEASGTALADGSGANHPGVISPAGVTYRATGLSSNSTYALTTNGSTGSLTTGFKPIAGSFSVSFFVSLRSNAGNYAHLAATGDPYDGSSSTGWNVIVNN